MATRTRAGNRVTATPVFKSKSDYARTLFNEGKTVAEVAHMVGIGYAFAYGIAKRAGKADTAANRRKAKFVTVVNGIAVITTTAGTIRVHPDGTIEKPKATRTARPA